MPTRIIEDPIFGSLVLETFWRGEVSASVFSGKTVLYVDTSPTSWEKGPGDPPGEEQQLVYAAFMRVEKDMRPAVEAAIYEFYQTVRPFYLDGRKQDEIDEEVPALNDPSEIWSLLDDPALFVPRQKDHPGQVFLIWKCSWDYNRGVEVVVSDGKVLTVRGEGDVPY